MSSTRKDGEMADKLVTCLWFDTQGEDAAKFYTSVFPSSRLGKIARYGFDLSPERAKRLRRLVYLRLVGDDDKIKSVLGADCRKFIADAGGSAGDDCELARTCRRSHGSLVQI